MTKTRDAATYTPSGQAATLARFGGLFYWTPMNKLAILLTLFAAPALASGPTSDTVTWTPPTQYDDGSAIAAGEITEYVVRWAGTLGGPYTNVIRVPAAVLTVDVPRAAPYAGRRCYVVTAVAGLESEYSAEICKTVKKPKAPNMGVS